MSWPTWEEFYSVQRQARDALLENGQLRDLFFREWQSHFHTPEEGRREMFDAMVDELLRAPIPEKIR